MKAATHCQLNRFLGTFFSLHAIALLHHATLKMLLQYTQSRVDEIIFYVPDYGTLPTTKHVTSHTPL